MEIRAMREADRDAVYTLLLSSLDEYFVPEIPVYFLAQWPCGQLVAADSVGNIVGYLAGARLSNGRVSVSLFCVAAPWRGQGVGSRLLIAFRQRAVMDGYRTIQLEVRTTNFAALEFYRRRGFLPTEKLVGFYNNGGDAIRMIGSAVLNS